MNIKINIYKNVMINITKPHLNVGELTNFFKKILNPFVDQQC